MLQEPVQVPFFNHFSVSSRILSFFDRLRPNYSTDFIRQLRTVRDISEILIQHDVLYVMFMPNFYARFTVRP